MDLPRRASMFSDAFTQADYAIGITDPEGIVVRVNEAFLRLYRIPDGTQVVGRALDLLWSPDTPDPVRGEMREAILSGRVWRGNVTHTAFDGTSVSVHLAVMPIRRNGRVVGQMRFAFDRSRQVLLEQELFHANRLAELGTLGAGLAHELNNPLAGILLDAGFLNESLERIPDPEVRRAAMEACQSVIRGAERMRRVLEDMLLYAKKDEVAPGAAIPLSGLLRDSLLFLERQLQSRGIEIRVECEAGIYVMGNRTQLESILHNLLGNSRDAFASHPRPDMRIAVSTTFLGEEGNALIRYRDNAGGIDPGIMDRIFDPFFTTKGGQGTGLGLAISRRLVERHGGTIECASRDGETEFRIRLPGRLGDAQGDDSAGIERSRTA